MNSAVLKLAGATTVLAALFGLSACEKAVTAPAAAQMPPPDVSFVDVAQQDIPVTASWVGTLDGYTNAQIQPQVSGYIIKQDYREGALVHKGDVLFEIDPRPFQAVLDQAKGQLAQAKGQLAQAQARLQLAEINVRRDTPLAKVRAIAQSQLDNDVQTKATAEATIETAKASIATSEAAIETAQLNLGFTKVRSLVDGIAGIATIQIGNLVGPSNVLTTVSKVNPIKAYFPISEQEYLQVSDRIKPGAGGDWLRNSAAVPLTLTLANGAVYGQKGHIVFTDRQVDPQTGTIRVVGAFPNPGNVLRPGQFGRVSALTNVLKGALVIPQRAVSELQGRYQVAVIGTDNKVSIHDVEVGERHGSLWVIRSGLKAGDRVVTEGLAKVRDGSVVNPKPDTSNPA
ncbi:MAG TPA: efflux RND transporter periplasmic adaptor subunit [Bryobacteraceae bacterium]|nr:efflux RND transporter periplasmic adaptor subunit [Bryobacteraceae bacterium]